MKKIYSNPSLEVVKIATAHQMLAGSLDPMGGKGTVSNEKVTDGTPGESRFGWFDEDEE